MGAWQPGAPKLQVWATKFLMLGAFVGAQHFMWYN